MKLNLRGLKLSALKEEIGKLDIPAFRADQIFASVHGKLAPDIGQVKGLPKELADYLSRFFEIETLEKILTTTSKDRTEKFLFGAGDTASRKIKIESVLIKEEGRNTVCVSTQAGCNAGCEFCATGKMGLLRNLTAGEIVSQIYGIISETGIIPTNLVFMGMGEPFLNYAPLMDALEILTDKKGLAISSRKITVSTVGFAGRIKKFADDISANPNLRNIKLALSLHSTDRGFRETLIPVSKKNTLPEIYDELVYFYRKTGNKVTYEYIYFEGLNDTDNDVKRLAKLQRMIPSNINVIPFHPVDFELKPPLEILNKKINEKIIHGKEKYLLNSKNLLDFIARLKKEKVIVNLRSSSGVDINAACGQLAVKN